jgi:hypothetical protein
MVAIDTLLDYYSTKTNYYRHAAAFGRFLIPTSRTLLEFIGEPNGAIAHVTPLPP